MGLQGDTSEEVQQDTGGRLSRAGRRRGAGGRVGTRTKTRKHEPKLRLRKDLEKKMKQNTGQLRFLVLPSHRTYGIVGMGFP
jgi:hypothetical protein